MDSTVLKHNLSLTVLDDVWNRNHPERLLVKVAQKNLEEVGGFRYTPEEKHFAQEPAFQRRGGRPRRGMSIGQAKAMAITRDQFV